MVGPATSVTWRSGKPSLHKWQRDLGPVPVLQIERHSRAATISGSRSGRLFTPRTGSRKGSLIRPRAESATFNRVPCPLQRSLGSRSLKPELLRDPSTRCLGHFRRSEKASPIAWAAAIGAERNKLYGHESPFATSHPHPRCRIQPDFVRPRAPRLGDRKTRRRAVTRQRLVPTDREYPAC